MVSHFRDPSHSPGSLWTFPQSDMSNSAKAGKVRGDPELTYSLEVLLRLLSPQHTAQGQHHSLCSLQELLPNSQHGCALRHFQYSLVLWQWEHKVFITELYIYPQLQVPINQVFGTSVHKLSKTLITFIALNRLETILIN